MTGIPFFNFDRFDWAASYLADMQYSWIFSPADNDRHLLGKPEDWLPSESDSIGPWKTWGSNIENPPTLRKMLGDDLAWIAQHATHIFMLKGWERSNGARAEHALAVALGLEIMYE